MTNTDPFEKLNDALTQLIEAYELLQNEKQAIEIDLKNVNEMNDSLEKDIDVLNNQKADLEYKVSDYTSSSDDQTNKMDGMLSKIQSLLNANEKEDTKESLVMSSEDSDSENEILDIDLRVEEHNDHNKESSSKIDLGRMESLLNGFNSK
jgi:chromosome segregation ATPase